MTAALAVALGSAACGSTAHRHQTARAAPTVAVVPAMTLNSAGSSTLSRPLPSRWGVSLDANLAAGSRLEVGFGGDTPGLTLSGTPGRWHHLEAIDRLALIDGHRQALTPAAGPTLTLRAATGQAHIRMLIISSLADRGSLLLHRVSELHARIPADRFPLGADLRDRIHYASTYWTSGFWPGALWEAAGMGGPGAATFTTWALRATIDHFGQERSDTHDVGFMYGESSLAAWQALCRPGTSDRQTLCARLRASVLAASGELLALARSNRGAGTIPTSSRGSQANTIVDSMMNIGILPWATALTGNPIYSRTASRHAHRVASLLVRPNGSTIQSVNFDRATGRVLFLSTHQGLSRDSTWSRGQGWAVYGFAQAAQELHDRSLLRVALHTAGYVASHLPAGGVPRWDYDAPPGAPVDVSAGAITAAGMLHLTGACRSMPGVCRDPGRWNALGDRMLAASLRHASESPPLGFLGSQVLSEGARGCWCNGGELIFGLTYALEAQRLEQTGS